MVRGRQGATSWRRHGHPAIPNWLSDWRARPLSTAEATARFLDLAAVEPEQMLGRWRGVGLPTGHPLDGLLETLGWYGKEFASPDEVQPLLFRSPSGRVLPLDPGLMPLGVAMHWPGIARGMPARTAFALLRPLLRARSSTARLRKLEFGGKSSAAMIYDRQPIIDHFRAVDEDLVLGLMETRQVRPFFFLLARGQDDE